MTKKFMTRTAVSSGVVPSEDDTKLPAVSPVDPEGMEDEDETDADEGEETDEGEGEETEGEGQQAATVDGEAFAERAKSLAGKETRELSDAFNAVIKAKEDSVGGVFKVMFALMNAYDDLDNWPEPGTETGNNPDHFKIPVVKDGKTTQRRTTFYTQFAENTREGAECVMKAEWCVRLDNDKAVKDDIDRYHLDLDPRQRATHLARYKGRIGSIRRAVIDAVKLYLQINAVNEMKGMKAEPMWKDGKSPDDVGEDGIPEVENTTKPIQVWQIPPEGKPIAKWTALSIGAFLRLKPKLAEEKGGTFQHLVDSGVVPRANGNTPGGDGKTAVNIKTLETGITALVETHRYFDGIFGNKDQKDVGLLYKALKAKDNDELVTSVVEMRNILDQAIKDCGLEKKYVAIQQRNPELASETAAAKPKAA